MPRAGNVTFTDPDDFRASVPGATIDLVFSGDGQFRARVTSLELPHVRLGEIHEWLPRIGFVALAPDPVFVSFAIRSTARRTWRGTGLEWGDLVLHAGGESFHERCGGNYHWGLVGVSRARLSAYARALTDHDILVPRLGQILRPSAAAAARLRLVHAMACRLVRTKPEIIVHAEAIRALEHDILHALVGCLGAASGSNRPAARGGRAEVMARFEALLATEPSARWHLPDLSSVLHVPQRTLRNYCAEVLGVSPSRYARLRRLNLVRAALRHADPATARVETIASRYGFGELGRFAAAYRTAFGETPSTTLRGDRRRRASMPARKADLGFP